MTCVSKDVKKSEISIYDGDDDDRPAYDALWSDAHQGALLSGPRSHFNRLLEDTASSGRVLVLGCGNGSTIARVEGFNDSGVVGIELSMSRLHTAAQRVAGELCRSDAEKLPFEDNTFDTVVSKPILHHLPNWCDDGLSEIHRVLSEGGSLVIYEPGRYNPPAFLRRRYFPSNIHTPDEKPFNPRELHDELDAKFSRVDINGHCLFSNILPVVFRSSPIEVPTRVTESVYRLEQPLTDTHLRQFAWILTGIAFK